MEDRRVVITGLGTINPVGATVDATWKNLLSGTSGIGRVQRIDVSDLPSKIAGEVSDFEVTDYIPKRLARRMDRYAQFFWVAARDALADAGIAYEEDDPEAYRTGVVVGTGIGGVESFEQEIDTLFHIGPHRVSPYGIPKIISNIAGGQVSIDFNLYGPNTTAVTACAASANALGDAGELIKRGAADVMVAGGADASITRFALAGFAQARALSTNNDDPLGASRPFDADRDGFVMAEGGAALILEEREHALARGATLYAELVGYGMSADAYHITLPRPGGDGAARAMKAALDHARIAPEDISVINAHGTSTQANDATETVAIKTVFGDRAYQIPVSSIKSMTGHLLGGAGAVEAIASVLTIRDGTIPPTINYTTPDPECDLDYVPNEAREAEVRYVMSNSFGFGGHNVALIFTAA
ncbi:MAG: beta-ketoacyl-ACP synthase II [Acidobacteria bacterium]|nr:beta-ketoacyl-ACP synthase II [Acidobacteriota bacterium]MCH8991981.1 beta-ketoacyl-ACP synthase II [Acidobacteriota bacterium]